MKRKVFPLMLAVCLLTGTLSGVLITASAAAGTKPATKAEFLAAFSAADVHEQSFGLNNISEDAYNNPVNHRAVFTQNGMSFQLSQTDTTDGLFADTNDVTVMFSESNTFIITLSGTSSVYSAFLGVIVADNAGNYLPGIPVSISVNGEAAEEYTTAALFEDNGFLILSDTPITTVELLGQADGSDLWNGLSYLILASKKLTPVAPSAPTVSGIPATTSITLNTIEGAEYSKDNGAKWQDSATFDGLTPNTGYTFIARIKATDSNYVSVNSAESAIIKTDKLMPAAPSAPTVSGIPATTSITLNTIEGAEYSKDGGTTWQDSTTFDGLTPKTDYTFIARIKATADSYASESSVAAAVKTAKELETDSPNTGDTQSAVPYIALCFAALGVLVTMSIKKRKCENF